MRHLISIKSIFEFISILNLKNFFLRTSKLLRMGSYVTKCNVCKSVQISPSAALHSKSAEKPTIKLLLLGLDNAGKTTTALHLLGDSLEDIIPTIGFSNLEMQKFYQFRVVMYDLGGGPRIRSIWKNYFGLIHGIIFVIDSSDISRILEVKDVIEEVVSNDKIAGKPILVLINKQDIDGALDELDICKYINLEPLINKFKCLTKVESCSANSRPDKAPKIDPAIDNGYQWLMNNIRNNWLKLNYRVEIDSNEQFHAEKKSLEERIKRFREIKSDTLDNNEDLDPNENPFKPINDLVKDVVKDLDLKNITELMKQEYNENMKNSYLDRTIDNEEAIVKIGSVSEGEDLGSTSDQSMRSLIQNESNEIEENLESKLSEKIISNKSPSKRVSVEVHQNIHQDSKEEDKKSDDLKSSVSLGIKSPQNSEKSITSNRSQNKPKRRMKVIRNSKVSPVLSKSS